MGVTGGCGTCSTDYHKQSLVCVVTAVFEIHSLREGGPVLTALSPLFLSRIYSFQ